MSNTIQKEPIRWRIWSFPFECKPFIYKGREAIGISYSIKINKNSMHPYAEGVRIELTKKHGFDILVDNRCKDFVVSPYKIYFDVMADDGVANPVEVSYMELMSHSKYFIEQTVNEPDVEWEE